MPDLQQFQRELAHRIAERRQTIDAERDPALRIALQVHRNTVMKALIDALTANYPTVAALVGQEWFDACAREYVGAHPARTPALVLYGESFPSFLAEFEPAADLPYLSEVARIDRLWIEAHTARDAAALNASALAQFDSSAIFSLRVELHPAARMGWFKHSAATIWIHHRTATAGAELEVDDREEGLLLTRPVGAVDHTSLDRAGFLFLDRIRSGASFGDAATAALESDRHANLARCFAQLVNAGAFVGPL